MRLDVVFTYGDEVGEIIIGVIIICSEIIDSEHWVAGMGECSTDWRSFRRMRVRGNRTRESFVWERVEVKPIFDDYLHTRYTGLVKVTVCDREELSMSCHVYVDSKRPDWMDITYVVVSGI